MRNKRGIIDQINSSTGKYTGELTEKDILDFVETLKKREEMLQEAKEEYLYSFNAHVNEHRIEMIRDVIEAYTGETFSGNPLEKVEFFGDEHGNFKVWYKRGVKREILGEWKYSVLGPTFAIAFVMHFEWDKSLNRSDGFTRDNRTQLYRK